MSSPFADFAVEWAGAPYTIPARKIMRAIAVVEDIVTLGELSTMVRDDRLKLSKVAAAYGALLRFAGASVDDEQVYAGLFSGGAQTTAMASINGLLGLMIPPSALAEAEASGKVEPGNGLAPTA